MTPSIKPAESCQSMEELRREIDRVDGALFDLFAERMSYIRRAPALKAPSGIPADVPARVDEVVQNARAHAERRGLDADLFETIWRALIAHAIATEEDVLGPSEQRETERSSD